MQTKQHDKNNGNEEDYNLVRRNEYISTSRKDDFIIPCLKEWIEQVIFDYIPAGSKGLRVLDVGCGRQPFRTILESRGCDYSGMDVHQNAENTVSFLGPIDGSLPRELTSVATFPIILCTEVLEHVANWPDAFRNIESLLAPGGCIIITCPHFYQLHEEPYDFFRPTNHAIEWHARRVGLVPERIDKLGNAWDVLGGVLANIYATPYRRSRLERIEGRLVRILFDSILFPLLRRRWFHRVLNPSSPLYLSNAAVLRKPL